MMTAAALFMASSAVSGAYGSFSVMRMVLASGASMLLMTLAAPLPRLEVSVQRFKDASTSDKSILEPSWTVMPWRSGIV
ncbi:hypothetical protein G6F57_023747 [Rhizopus arrhizus]|nr:hypothetical protein G6F57_023747 [Rhizopus arrhizus]